MLKESCETPTQQPLLLLISGPAGCGKTTLCDALLAQMPERLTRVVTATTRPPRQGEIDGTDYYFHDHPTFQQKIAQGAFYEHALIHGNHYGTLRQEITSKLAGTHDVLLNIDVQGAHAFRQAAQQDPHLARRMATVFVLPPNLDVLRQRMHQRGKDSPQVIECRLHTARQEIPQWRHYDYTIVTTTRQVDYDALHAIYHAEKLRVRP